MCRVWVGKERESTLSWKIFPKQDVDGKCRNSGYTIPERKSTRNSVRKNMETTDSHKTYKFRLTRGSNAQNI